MINAGARRILKATAVAGGAAAVGSANAEAKMDGGEPDKHRVIFAPNKTPEKEDEMLSLNRKQLSKIAIWEIKDAPKDTLTDMVLSLGEDLAKDPAVQMAVYKKFGLTMPNAIQGSSEEMDLDDREASRDQMEEQLAYLKDELESQQTLNDQLIYHNDKLAEEKIKLKRELYAQKYELERANRERERLKEKLRELGDEEKAAEAESEDQRNEARHQPPPLPEEETWDMSQVVVKALAVAAVVILMAIVKKKGVVNVAAGAAVGAWGWFRTKMKI
mmetsp:Transcript_33406/g.62105  ORF Transcript_33406/g.62105 Transcript_33406/m.62105 type:complete len:274 (-) Transcript_33406:498-1319(-)|eukprot:CAMPEP_0170178216 /NCGR_PEP_ID=MMETSP0040_2-20121228/11741_1 /TAXON_ID=641309 /ORGANISM="Lotharella oceanica, Strain CCMP622" /LENGTH=273 /DNA_ID=CAMNT_0010421219 /DNA_START=94 /DNA_END=915 /DNA_ORIENTATION=+